MSGEPRARGISLWLVPEGATGERLAGLIDRLAARLGTTAFAPHVTLLPGVSGAEDDVLGRARALATDLEPFSIEFSGIDGHDAHFRCLFFRVGGSPVLREAHARAARRFDRAPDPTFDPHLSLVYGSLAAAAKAELTPELEARIPAPLVARRLHVWRTEGAVGDWRELVALDLGPGIHKPKRAEGWPEDRR